MSHVCKRNVIIFININLVWCVGWVWSVCVRGSVCVCERVGVQCGLIVWVCRCEGGVCGVWSVGCVGCVVDNVFLNIIIQPLTHPTHSHSPHSHSLHTTHTLHSPTHSHILPQLTPTRVSRQNNLTKMW